MLGQIEVNVTDPVTKEINGTTTMPTCIPCIGNEGRTIAVYATGAFLALFTIGMLVNQCGKKHKKLLLERLPMTVEVLEGEDPADIWAHEVERAEKKLGKEWPKTFGRLRKINKHAKTFGTRFKILISLVQVVNGVGLVVSIRWPPFFLELMLILRLFAFDINLPELMSLSCLFPVNYYGTLTTKTAFPIGIVIVLNSMGAIVGRFTQDTDSSDWDIDGDGVIDKDEFFKAQPKLKIIAELAAGVADRGLRQLGSGPVASKRGAMLVENRVASRIIGTLVGPLGGGSIYEQRSCMSEKLGESVASSAFTLLDAPHLPRGMGSRMYDGDGRPTKPRTLIEDGILQQWLINVYYGRKLERTPTTGGTSNLVVPAGSRSCNDILRDLDWAIHVDGFLGGNSNPATGRYSFGIRGTLFENGVAVKPISEMNISGSIFDLMGGFIEAADDPWLFGSCRSPSLLFDAVQFSGA